MISELELAIKQAIECMGENKEANKAYLEFIKANFIIPIDKNSDETNPEALYLEENGQIFLPAFSEMQYFEQWAKAVKDQINLLKLSGVDLLKGIGEQVIVCLNIGSAYYKEFNPSELARMKNIIMKLYA